MIFPAEHTKCCIKKSPRLFMVVSVLIFSAFLELHACGPNFPNWLLVDTEYSVMSAPLFDFNKELMRMRLAHPNFKAVRQPELDYPKETLDTEIGDLLKALEREGITPENRTVIAENHRREREKISVFAGIPADTEFILLPDSTEPPRIPGAPPSVVPGLPGEFADYLLGSIAWHSGDMKTARKIWTTLLERPKNERHFKSTWAAFMLGRSWHTENPNKAVAYYKKVRELAEKGFADSLGLAASSLGWEACISWSQNKYAESFDLYLQQVAGGDLNALISLRAICDASFGKGAGTLRLLAKDEKARRTITAYIVAYGELLGYEDVDGIIKETYLRAEEYASAKLPAMSPYCTMAHTYKSRAKLWLETIENTGVKDSECFDKLALAAYQDGEMDIAKRWINCAPGSPLCKWITAKLLLREGKMDDAANILAELVRLFPLIENGSAPPGTYPLKFRSFYQNTYIPGWDGYTSRRETANQINGEYAVLQLVRRQYVEALDALTRSGFQDDASYVAEKVLEVEELKKYVDANWPSYLIVEEKESVSVSEPPEEFSSEIPPEPVNGYFLRYLLARRLARNGLAKEARCYYPNSILPIFDKYCHHLETAENIKLPGMERACAYFEAAKIARHKGMELFGTELEPDWFCYDGDFESGPSLSTRTMGSFCTNASSDEIMRAGKHIPKPNTRFHYRYNAAELAWKAAELMPDNSDETARVLCIAGSWLKNRDPGSADKFYKALVRRCPNTELGAEADRKRWFPNIEEKEVEK